MANAKMAVARRQMKATLKDDIIDGILAEDTDGKDEKEPPTLIPKLLSGIWSPSVGR